VCVKNEYGRFLGRPCPMVNSDTAEFLNKKYIDGGKKHNDEHAGVDSPEGKGAGDFPSLLQESKGNRDEPEGRPEEQQGNQWRPYHADHRKWKVS